MVVCCRPECQTSSGCAHRGPHFELCWFPSTANDIRVAVLAERARCAKIAETEEELEGAPPFEMSAESIHVARAIVRATKKSIARRIRADLKDNSDDL